MRRFSLLLITGMIVVLLYPANFAAQQPASGTVLTNADVVSMTKSGLGADVILTKINVSSCDFDTSPNALESLKSQGVPDTVILAMVKKASANPPNAQAASANAKEVSSPTIDTPSAVSVKPTLTVDVFSVASGLPWPYDMKQLQAQTIAELKIKDGQYFDVTDTPAVNGAKTYTLDGKVIFWHPGNRATRMLVGFGSGRETAKIHYWLTDQQGHKVFDQTDMIRQAFWNNAYANSVGQLAQPFADKIAKRIADAKLF